MARSNDDENIGERGELANASMVSDEGSIANADPDAETAESNKTTVKADDIDARLKAMEERTAGKIDKLKEEMEELNKLKQQEIDELKQEIDEVKTVVNGIRKALTPATVYGLLETAVTFVFTERRSNARNRYTHPNGRAVAAKNLPAFMHSATHFANYALCKMMGIEGVDAVPWNGRVMPTEFKMLYAEALSGLVLFLKHVPKKYLQSGRWPTKRNTVAHDGMLLQAVYPAIPDVPNGVIFPGNMIPLTEDDAVVTVNGIMKTHYRHIYSQGELAIDKCKRLLTDKFGFTVSSDTVLGLKTLINQPLVAS